MEDVTSLVLVFLAGGAAGSLITLLLPRLSRSRKRRTELVKARARILAGVKQQHEQDIQNEIFRTAEAIRGELNSSLFRLVKSTEQLLGQVYGESNGQKKESVAK